MSAGIAYSSAYIYVSVPSDKYLSKSVEDFEYSPCIAFLLCLSHFHYSLARQTLVWPNPYSLGPENQSGPYYHRPLPLENKIVSAKIICQLKIDRAF